MENKPTLIIYIGIPATGKTTSAKYYVQQHTDFVRVERDELRQMSKGIQIGDKQFESFITEVHKQAIYSAFRNGYNVVVSDTNCNLKRLSQFIEEFKYVSNIIIDVHFAPIEDCIKRDAIRTNKVGEDVIRKMYIGFTEVVRSGIVNDPHNFSYEEYQKELEHEN